jgi:hypothetical protein
MRRTACADPADSAASVRPQPGIAAADTGPVARAPAAGDWRRILGPGTGLLLLDRPAPVPAAALQAALGDWPGRIGLDLAPELVAPALAALPAALATDIAALAARFAALVGSGTARLSCERILGDACRKWHVDYIDLRLVCTYWGPGTDWRDPRTGAEHRIGPQQPALFKGRLYGDDAPLVEHRSPPIAGTGQQRLVLVIDTPEGPPV